MAYKNLREEIIEKCPIVDVVSSFVKTQKKGANYVCLCPFHQDSNPSLSISPAKKFFKCFVCGTKGNVIDFVSKYKKISENEAMKYLCEKYNIDYTNFSDIKMNKYLKNKDLYDLNKQVTEWYSMFLYEKCNEKQLSYLYKRGLNNEIIKHFNIGYAPNSSDKIYKMATNFDNIFGDQANKWTEQQLLDCGLITLNNDKYNDFFKDRIIFPIKDIDGNIVGYSGRTSENINPKYLNSGECKLFKKSNNIYNINNINFETQKLILCEGYMDCIAYYRANYGNVVSLMGVTLSKEQINILTKFSKLNTIILSLDNDNAGKEAMISIGKELLSNKFNVFVINYTNIKEKDVDEIINTHGNETLHTCINQYMHFFEFLIKYEFSRDMPKDEKITKTKEIISLIEKLDDKLLIEEHYALLSSLSNFSLESIKKTATNCDNKVKSYTNTYTKTSSYSMSTPVKEKKYLNIGETKKNKYFDKINTILNQILTWKTDLKYITNKIQYDIIEQYFPKQYNIFQEIISGNATTFPEKFNSIDISNEEKYKTLKVLIIELASYQTLEISSSNFPQSEKTKIIYQINMRKIQLNNYFDIFKKK